MPETSSLALYMSIPLPVEAVVEGPRLTVKALLALAAGSVIGTTVPAGNNVEVRAGGAAIGAGELTAPAGNLIVRILTLQRKD